MDYRFVSLAFISLLLAGTPVRAKSDSTFIVKGVIDTVPHATYVIGYRHKGQPIRDTLSLDGDRKFEYKGVISEPTRFTMIIDNSYNPALVGDFYVYEFWVEPGTATTFTGHANWLYNGVRGLVPRGSITRNQQSEMESMEQRYRDFMAQSIKAVEENADRPPTAAVKRQLSDSLRRAFIRNHTDSYHSLYQLYQMYRVSDKNLAFVEESLPTFPQHIRNTYLAKEIEQRLAIQKMTAIGQRMPDFEQNDSSGNPVSLSDFRGKYVLVDFWASWCGPCRKEHPHLVKAYADYKDQGFEIVGISLDGSKKSWLKAIEQDGLTWPQLSDLRGGLDNQVAKQLFIEGVPDNFLLDPDGVILARGLRGGQLLEALSLVFSVAE